MLGKRRFYRLGLCGIALLMGMQTGCLQWFHPVYPLPPEEVRDDLQIPVGCKNGVYFFMLHGIDPFDLANLQGVRDYVQSLGYIKTYFGQPYHAFYYEKEIIALRKRDPNARIVVLGFSYSAGLVRDLACAVAKHGIDIDLLVYVDGVELDDRPLIKPANVHKVINILAHYCRDRPEVVDAENMRFEDVWHFGTVTHPRTLRMLVRELGEIALRVPVITELPPRFPGDIVPAPETLPAPKTLPAPETLPAPKEIPTPKVLPAPEVVPTPKVDAKRGEWEFLRPDSFATGALGSKPLIEAVTMKPELKGKK